MLTLKQSTDSAHDQFPDVKAGEVHAVSVLSKQRAFQLAEFIAVQQPSLVISPWNDEPNDERNALSANCTLATWKYTKRLKTSSIRRSLEVLSKGLEAIVYIIEKQASDAAPARLQMVVQGELAQFARHHMLPVVVVLVDFPLDQVRTALITPLSQLTSVQSIEPAEHGDDWLVHYWFSHGRVLQFDIDVLDESAAASTSSHAAAHEPVLLGNRAPKYAVADALASTESLPKEWRVIESYNDIQDYIEPGVDGVILLPFTKHSEIQTLLKTVHGIRKYAGPYWKIVIRERNSSVRLYEEKVLLQAGVTLVVPQQLPLNRLLSLVESVSGWKFEQRLATLETLSGRLKVSSYKGYLEAAEFFQVVPQIAQRNAAYKLDFSLIFAHPAAGVSSSEILSRCKIQREGDLITSTREGVYIFLPACRANDVDKVLFSLFSMPVSHLFSGEDRAQSLHAVQFICERALQAERALPSKPMPVLALSEDEDARRTLFYPQPAPVSSIQLRKKGGGNATN
ncbi:BcsE family c-di-GMP-binding protein [Aliidiomarina soli]|uniref:Cellulose biosynthesis protein BcsE n=1 Tax=Aliidiomarina soli TaxID=1928574 RepID=A0A432WMS7_9GAMM|nr:BcsE family c-di-GMP-binding protein [Aliidiomarina soli]RUO35106.1 hypothetical protein CWE14_03675 [Aliidiomarina soli]